MSGPDKTLAIIGLARNTAPHLPGAFAMMERLAATVRLERVIIVTNDNEDGTDAVLAWNFFHSANHPAFRSAGFMSFPESLRPIELHFGVRVLDNSSTPTADSTNKTGLVKRESWYLSYCDSDTV